MLERTTMQHPGAFVVGRQNAYPSETRLLLLASTGTVAFTFLLLTVLQPVYQTNDDPAMRMTASGLRTGRPSEHLIHINILAGRVLKFLYETFPAVYWYDIYLYGSIVIAMTVMMFSMLRLSAPRRWPSLLFPLLIYPLIAIQPQFTIAAGLCAGALAVLVISSAIQPPRIRSGWIVMSILVATCSVLAVSLRFNQALVVFGTVMLAALLPLLVRHRGIRWHGPLLLTLLALGVGYAIHAIAMNEYLKDEGYRKFAEFNTYRVRVQEYLVPRWENHDQRAVLEAAGWGQAEYNMFYFRFTTNEKLFGLETLKKIHAGLLAIQTPGATPDLTSVVNRQCEVLWNSGYPMLTLALGAILLMPSRWWGALAFLSALLVIVATAIMIDYVAKPPPFRVMFPIFISCLAVALLFAAAACIEQTGPPSRIESVVCLTGLLGLLTAGGLIAANVLRMSNDNKVEVAAVTADMDNYDTSNRIHVWGSSLKFSSIYYLPPFTSAKPFTWVGLGWAIEAPIEKDKRAALGLQDVALDLCTRPDMYYMADLTNFDMLKDYIWDQYQLRTKPEVVFSGRRLFVYRCVKE